MTATHNGTCQACGRSHAIRANGRLAQHGYTVDYGYFNGVCSGSEYPPLELQTGHNEQVCINLREWADAQDAAADGEILTVPVTKRERGRLGQTIKTIVHLDCEAYAADRSTYGSFDRAVESLRWQYRRAAEQARAQAVDLEKLREVVHGQPVKPRAVEAPLEREYARSYREAYARVEQLKAEGYDARQRRQQGYGFVITYRKKEI